MKASTIFLLVLLCATHSASADIDRKRLARIDDLLNQYVADGKIAGAVVRIGHRGRVVKHDAYGMQDIEAGVAMQKDSIFRIASQTKAVISVGIMMLQEEGKLLISHPLSRYMPEWKDSTVAGSNDAGEDTIEPAKRAITLRDLLTHTAGIDYGDGPGWREAGINGWYFAHRDEPIRETVRRMAPLPQAAQPGERFVYGYSTDILGAVIEVASGMPLDQFLKQKIFNPLAMTDTHFYLPNTKTARLATVYSASDDTIKRTPDASAMVGQGAYVAGPRKSFSGGAGLLSTASDYGRFLDTLLLGGRLDGQRIMGRKTVDLMTTDHLRDVDFRPGSAFGLGFLVVDDVGATGEAGSVGNFGWGGAYHTTYWVDPVEELTFVYMTQLLPAGGLDDSARLRALIYQAVD